MSALPEHCWRVIGVQGGDHTCERLEEVLHCRNCPVYAQAARALLQRDSAAQSGDEALLGLRRTSQRDTVLVFRLGRQWLGLPPSLVLEVAANPPVRRLAHRTSGRVEGIVNVRGDLRLCVSLAELLGLGSRVSVPATARLVLVDDPSGPLAFRCDEVRGLQSFAETQLQPPPDTLRPPLDGCVRALIPADTGAIALLDGDAVAKLLRTAVFE